MKWRFSSEIASLGVLRQRLQDAIVLLPLSTTSCDQLILAAHETAANLIRHVLFRPVDGFSVELFVEEEELIVQFSYEGRKFDPSSVPEPNFDGSQESGFGLYLIQLCVDLVTYDCDEKGMNRVTLIRRLKDPLAVSP